MDAVEEIKLKLDIVDIVGEYLQLKPAGTASFKSNCPFHQEKTPSFFVNRTRQSWHCFGCDIGGDVISFVQQIEGLEFREALQLLADKAGIEIPSYDGKSSGDKKRLHEINELAAKYYRWYLLKSPDADRARAYAKERGIDDMTGDLFHIGYAPDSWDKLSIALKEKGVTDDELVKAGLAGVKQHGSGVYDRFRNRLMFAFQDVHGNIVGFTGRQLNSDSKEAKYVNTPETQVYKKSAILYGLDKAKGEIKAQDLCVICEGNMDVLSSHRIGVTNVVCSSGTALTAEQLKLISRFTKNLAIAFDDDSAGMAATLRGLDLARSQDFHIKIITIPEGKDPDEVIQRDPELWKHAIRDALDILDWIFQRSFKDKNLSHPEAKRQIAKEVLPEIKRIVDPVVRDHWIQKLANQLSISPDALRDAIRGVKTTTKQEEKHDSQKLAIEPKPKDRQKDLTEQLLTYIYKKPALFEYFSEAVDEYLHEAFKELYKKLKNAYDSAHFQEAPDPSILNLDQNQLSLYDYIATRTDRDFPDKTKSPTEDAFQQTLLALQHLYKQQKRTQLEEEMRAAEASGDHARVQELTQAFQQLI